MFDWFWEFLYGLTKSILRIIDTIIACTNKLCGIEPISVDGQETDFMSYVLTSESISNGFRVAAVLGFVVLIAFTIIRILMVITKEKPDMSPGQVCVKSFKILLTFLFVPAIMVALVYILNTFMQVMYDATLNGRQSLGTFLFQIFSEDSVTNPGQWETIISSPNGYLDTDAVKQAIVLSDFDFLLSWLTGILLIFNLGNALLVFVDRAISIAVLFIVSPFSISSAILDDGARFKLWREQLIVKFIVGYGMIIFFNVYCLLVGLVTPDSVVFFTSKFMNGFFKIIIIVGGGYATIKSVSLIGNLISAGAGSRELMDAHVGGLLGKAAGAVGTIGKGAWKLGKWAAGKASSGGGSSQGNSVSSSNGGSGSDGGESGTSGEPMDKKPKFNQNFKMVDKIKNNDESTSNNKGNNLLQGGKEIPKDNASGGNNNSNQNNNKNELNQRREKEIKDALKTGSVGNNGQSGNNL